MEAMTEHHWSEIATELRDKLGSDSFETWIAPLDFGGLSDGVLTLGVISTFAGDWIERSYGAAILDATRAAGLPVRRLSFRPGLAADAPAARRAARRARPAAKPAAPARPAPDGAPLSGAPLNPAYTFERFVTGAPNEVAFAAARRMCDPKPLPFNPLFLYGDVGLGKTHLMHAIAWETQRLNPQARVIYLSAEQFMYRFVQALQGRETMGFKELFRSVDVLMVDDVQFIAGKDSTQEEFFHTFNALVDQRKRIVITANAAPGEIPGLEERIVSRLASGLAVDVHPTTYDLRLGILERKAPHFAEQFPGAVVGDGVLEFLARKITSNVRELEGAFTRIYAHASFLGREVDVALAQECLRDILRKFDRRTTIDEIQHRVAEHYNIRMNDLLGPRRTRIYARPRQVAMYLAKELTDRSLPEIARKFGGRDHTTIMHGIRRIAALSAEDRQIAEDVDLLRRSLRSA